MVDHVGSGDSPERIMEMITALTHSIKTLIKRFQEVWVPLEESTQKVPQVKVQLERVTHSTEEATHHMLDTIGQITFEEEEIVKMVGMAQGYLDRMDPAMATELGEILKRIGVHAQLSLDNAFLLMEALQFQDITAQQIGYANGILEEIEEKLNELLAILGGEVEVIQKKPDEGRRKGQYNPDADFDLLPTKQAEIDAIISEAREKG